MRPTSVALGSKHQPQWRRALAFAIAMAVMLATLIGAAPATAAEPDQQSLEAQALAGLRDKYQRLVDPASRPSRALVDTTVPGGGVISAAERIARMDALRISATRDGVSYTDATVTLRDTALVRHGGSLVLRATEQVLIGYRVSHRAPRSDDRWTEEFLHEFIFELSAGEWRLSFDRVLWPQAPTPNDPDAPVIDPSRALTHQRPEQRGAPRPTSPRPFSAWGTFDVAAAVNYARTWYNGHNTYYPHYGANDCANFMSQTKAAGGWTAKGGHYLDQNAWWYDGSSMSHSNTWSLANWLLGFTTNSGRGYFIGAFSDLSVGDYLYADWGFNGVSNTPEHSMIVTTRLSGNYWDIKLTYHSNPNLDKPLQQVMNENPGSVYWGVRVPYTSN